MGEMTNGRDDSQVPSCVVVTKHEYNDERDEAIVIFRVGV